MSFYDANVRVRAGKAVGPGPDVSRAKYLCVHAGIRRGVAFFQPSETARTCRKHTMAKHGGGSDGHDAKKAADRAEAMARQVGAQLEEMRFRLAALEAWILDKEHAGLTTRTRLQNVSTKKFFADVGRWVEDPAEAAHFATVLNAVHFSHSKQLRNVQVVLEVERTSGVALMPVALLA